MDKKKQAQV